MFSDFRKLNNIVGILECTLVIYICMHKQTNNSTINAIHSNKHVAIHNLILSYTNFDYNSPRVHIEHTIYSANRIKTRFLRGPSF